jgi:tetratricopeptide (TPR) repeat protein
MMDKTGMDAWNRGNSAKLSPEAKAIWLPVKPSPIKGLFHALRRLPAPLMGLAFQLAGSFNSWRRWYTLVFALLMFFGTGGTTRAGQSPEIIKVIQTSVPSLEAYGRDFLARLEESLAPGSVEQVSSSEEANIRLELTSIEGKTIAVTIEPLTSPLDASSHILATQFDFPIVRLEYAPDDIDVESIVIHFIGGLAQYTVGSCATAVERLELERTQHLVSEAINRADLVPYIAFYEAGCYLSLYQQSVYDISKAIDLFKTSCPTDVVTCNINFAWAYLQANQPNAAESLIAKLTEQANCSCDQELIFAVRAQLYALTERYDDAIHDLTAALDYNPDSPALYSLRGQMYLALYEWDKALADYNAALELAPDYSDAYYYRGVLYTSILQTGLATRDQALADFRRYLELAPDSDHAAEAAQAIADLEAAQDALNG